jgi:hypothetical protein
VARPVLTRACGHSQEFQHYEVDKYRTQRQAKFVGTRCAACVAELEEGQRAAGSVPKREALGRLPPGARVSLILREGGAWAGALDAGGEVVEFSGAPGAGPQSVVVALARLWLSARARSPEAGPE